MTPAALFFQVRFTLPLRQCHDTPVDIVFPDFIAARVLGIL